MGDETFSLDWLPAGWKVEVRVRKNGKKDRCYIDPSNERKLYSKPEVLRYLKSVGINHPLSDAAKKKSSGNHSAIKIVVKEAVAEGLPAGWIKEIRVTTKGNKIRRDPYYIDPVSGHNFRSMNEVFRYLDTGKMGRPGSISEDKSPIKRELRHRPFSSPTETGNQRLASSKIQKLVIENRSLNSAAEAPALNNADLTKSNKLEQNEKNEKSSEKTSSMVLQEVLQTEKGVEGQENVMTKCKKKRKLKDKRAADLPRRTSKRLAGIEVDLPLEIKVPTRVRQSATSPINDGEAKCPDNCQNINDSSQHDKRLKTGNDANEKKEGIDIAAPGDVPLPAEAAHAMLGVAECKGDKKQETSLNSSLTNLWKEPCVEGVAECNGDEKPEMSLNSSLTDLWKDPCIEFAIKTLKGEIPIGDDDNIAKIPGSSVDMRNSNPEPNQGLPIVDLWTDPCFEFAVKTLTGEISMVNNTCIQTLFEHQHSSSTGTGGGQNGLSLPNFK